MTEPFYRYKMTNNSWQERWYVVQTLDEEEFEKIDVREIRELLQDESGYP
jgi:hypothetical protein